MPQVNFRMSAERLALIDRAAASRGVSRTEFVLRSSEAAAVEVLMERPIITLDDEVYDEFIAALDAPVRPNPGLKKLLRAPPVVATLTEPESLGEGHDVAHFDSGVPTIDSWLRNMARLNEALGGARTYVVCEGDRVVGFYSLAASAVERRRLPSRVGRNMPEPVPVILLGQLAVDTRYQGRGLGVRPAGRRGEALAGGDRYRRGALDGGAGARRQGEGVLRAVRLPALLGARAADAGPAHERTPGDARGLRERRRHCRPRALGIG